MSVQTKKKAVVRVRTYLRHTPSKRRSPAKRHLPYKK